MQTNLRYSTLPLAFFAAFLFAQETPQDESIKQMLESLDKITITLTLIQNEQGSKDVRGDLKKEVEEWDKLRKKAEALPPPTPEQKERIARENRPKLEMATKKFLAEIERVRRIPGAKDTLQELRPLLEYKTK